MFRSDRYIFRPTSMSLAFERVGVTRSAQFIRERKTEVINPKIKVKVK